MKIILKHWIKDYEMTVAQAFEHKFNEAFVQHSGHLESISDKNNAIGKTFTALVEILSKKGLLTESEVLELLGYGYEVKEGN
jgi:hypothetical protein